MFIEKVLIGEIRNEKVFSYNLRNSEGFGVNILNYGGIITDILVPDRYGNIENVITKYSKLEAYKDNPSYYGALIGRTSGRIANGITEVNGEEVKLSLNYGVNQGHGGVNGFNTKFFEVKTYEDKNEAYVELYYYSRDYEEGYPGNLEVRVKYSINESNIFKITYKGISDKDTLINLTNHSYFNLSGNCKENILNHSLYVNSNYLFELNKNQVPTGKLIEVKESPFDCNVPKSIGRDIEDNNYQLEIGQGYDHPWSLNDGDEVKLKLFHKSSGRCMEVYTNNNCLVLYTMNYPDNEIMENGNKPKRRDGIAIEAQSPPIGVNNCFKEYSYLKKNEEYFKETIYKFSTI